MQYQSLSPLCYKTLIQLILFILDLDKASLSTPNIKTPTNGSSADSTPSPPVAKRKKSKLVRDKSPSHPSHHSDDLLLDFFEESCEQRISLPTFGQVEVRDVYKRSSAVGKVLTYQQTLQLGMVAVRVCFHDVLRKQYRDDDSFMEQLFCIIFFTAASVE